MVHTANVNADVGVDRVVSSASCFSCSVSQRRTLPDDVPRLTASVAHDGSPVGQLLLRRMSLLSRSWRCRRRRGVAARRRSNPLPSAEHHFPLGGAGPAGVAAHAEGGRFLPGTGSARGDSFPASSPTDQCGDLLQRYDQPMSPLKNVRICLCVALGRRTFLSAKPVR